VVSSKFGEIMISLREIRFFACTIGTLMIYKVDGTGIFLNVAAMNALLNLFSGQHLCVTGTCSTEQPMITLPYLPVKITLFTDPIAIFHYVTTLLGVITLVYGTVSIWG
jgi:hypothetical protein